MDKSEEKVLLTIDDIEIIKGFIEKPNMRLAVFMLIFVVISYIFSKIISSVIPLIVTIIFFGVALSWYILQLWRTNECIRNGYKKIISGKLEKKLEKKIEMKASKNFSPSLQLFYFFVLYGKEYMIPYKYFDEFNEGDNVDLYLTLPDEMVFKISSKK